MQNQTSYKLRKIGKKGSLGSMLISIIFIGLMIGTGIVILDVVSSNIVQGGINDTSNDPVSTENVTNIMSELMTTQTLFISIMVVATLATLVLGVILFTFAGERDDGEIEEDEPKFFNYDDWEIYNTQYRPKGKFKNHEFQHIRTKKSLGNKQRRNNL